MERTYARPLSMECSAPVSSLAIAQCGFGRPAGTSPSRYPPPSRRGDREYTNPSAKARPVRVTSFPFLSYNLGQIWLDAASDFNLRNAAR